MRQKSILPHALTMVWRERRSYALLSVTVVLSLALLLGYMLFTDSRLYNRYRFVMAQDSSLVEVEFLGQQNREQMEQYVENAARLGEIRDQRWHYTCLGMGLNLQAADEMGEHSVGIPVEFVAVDTQFTMPVWAQEVCRYTVDWLAGKERDCLEVHPGEILLEEDLFYGLGLDKQAEPRFAYELEYTGSGEHFFQRLDLKVAGILHPGNAIHREDSLARFLQEQRTEHSSYSTYVFVNKADLSPVSMPQGTWQTHLDLYTDHPAETAQLAEKMFSSVGVTCCAREQAQALQVIQAQKHTKGLIAMSLLLLLGINLYSCFENALSRRRFEIGVKRALGASKWHIIRQFLCESVLVMAACTLIAVWLAVTVLLVYKLVQQIPGEIPSVDPTWTVYLSPYSFGIFAVCAVTLTVVFSLIFAYRSTQVEVVQYLKAE